MQHLTVSGLAPKPDIAVRANEIQRFNSRAVTVMELSARIDKDFAASLQLRWNLMQNDEVGGDGSSETLRCRVRDGLQILIRCFSRLGPCKENQMVFGTALRLRKTHRLA